jgi:hypothetical protein
MERLEEEQVLRIKRKSQFSTSPTKVSVCITRLGFGPTEKDYWHGYAVAKPVSLPQ